MTDLRGGLRGVRGRVHRTLAVGLGSAVCLVAAGAPAALGQAGAAPAPGTGVPVVACPAQAGGPVGAPAPTDPPIPSTVAVPPVTLPSGSALYGTTQPGDPSVTYSIGPAGFRCTAGAGADGAYYMELTAPGATAPAFAYQYNAGGAGIDQSAGCGYFPALEVPASEGGTTCDPPPHGEVVRPIAITDGTGLMAATTVDPPGVLPSDEDPSHGHEESVGVVLAASNPSFQSARCTVPPSQRPLCLAGLDLFLEQSLGGQSGAASLAAIRDAISDDSAPDAHGGECPVALDATMESEINSRAYSPISVPDESIAAPPAVPLVVQVSFVPGEAKVCDTGLAPVLGTPDGFDNGLLTLRAKVGSDPARGPFTYSADATAWTSAPGAPSGQTLKTEFNPLSIDAAVDPHLSIAYETGGSSPGVAPVLQLAHITISALQQEVTLVGPTGPLLKVGLAPSLELSAGFKKKDAEEKVKDAEDAGEDEADAETQVADQISGDAVFSIEEAASEFDGLDISGDVAHTLFDQLQVTLNGALEADPVLVALAPAAADAAASEITAGDAAAIDAETAGEAGLEAGGVDVLGDVFLIFLF